MKKLFYFLGLILSIQTFAQDKQNIDLFYVSLEKGQAQPLKQIPFTETSEKIRWGHEIKVYPNIEHQTIEGIGGAFNEIGGEALLSLDHKLQREVLQNLFDKDKAGFTFCRTAIGASDFGIDAYSYSETPEDYNMDYFSIERDQKFVLPYLKAALAINPDLLIFGSPWSPPAWMKNNNSMTGLTEKPNTFRDENKVYKAYAKYFAEYVKAYESEGVKINRICVQNENDANTKYPSCTMPPAQMLKLAHQYIIPTFKKEKLNTKVFAGTFRTALNLDMIEFLGMENADKIDGIGLQYTSKSIITDAVRMQANIKMFHTEGHCYNGKNSVEQAEHRLEEAADYINSGLTNYCYWNMILNETTKSGWDWKQNSLINIDREKKTIQYNPDYNAMYILGHFIKPNDIRVASTSHRPMITVKSPDGKVKILIQNTDEKEAPYRLKINGEIRDFKIPAKGITAIVYNLDNKKL
ncbi:glycoside hydrolase family 30 protein [Sediminitomix flava]|uniref:Glucosylceramidase n=1 Tax=Sediminitomix flava TaxID=379075 RepID=A0A315Z4B7_SEDFL|nr:hypothetical protein [Sediminitomix flava]PWJ37929.1 glucosylceramidase [Sediminitomix flava]